MVSSRLLILALLLVASTGCARSGRTVGAPARWDEGAIRAHLRQLAGPVAVTDSTRAARRVLYAARQMEIAGLMPARDPSFLVAAGGAPPALLGAPNPAQAHVLGYVTGRHPSYYDELVLVVADLDRPGAAAALEVARLLAYEARDTQVPERTVLFALWAPPHTGALGLQDYLANPTWGLDHVDRVLLVTTDTSTVVESQRLLDARGIAYEVVTSNQSVAVPSQQPDVVQAFALVNTTLLTQVLDVRLRTAAIVEDSAAVGPAVIE